MSHNSDSEKSEIGKWGEAEGNIETESSMLVLTTTELADFPTVQREPNHDFFCACCGRLPLGCFPSDPPGSGLGHPSGRGRGCGCSMSDGR